MKRIIALSFFCLSFLHAMEEGFESVDIKSVPPERPRSYSDPILYYYSLTLFGVDPVTLRHQDEGKSAPTPPPSPVFEMKSRKESCVIS